MNELIKIFGNIKITRNFQKYPFVSKMIQEQKNELVKTVIFTLQNAQYKCIILDENTIKANHDYFNILYGIKYNQNNSVLFIPANENQESDIYIILNQIDHIQFVTSVTRNQDFNKIYQQISVIEETIGTINTYQSNLKFGYLSPKLANAGIGVQLSYILHGIGILATENNEFFSNMSTRGYEITRMCAGEEKKTDFIKIVSNRQYGISENELIEQFVNGIEKFAEIENRQLLKYYNNNKEKIDDTILRSFGILQYSKSINMADALLMLADIITGLRVMSLQYINQEAKSTTVGDLLLRIFDQDVIAETCTKFDDIKIARADIIKEFLKNIREC